VVNKEGRVSVPKEAKLQKGRGMVKIVDKNLNKTISVMALSF
jgi:hypothetical protein